MILISTALSWAEKALDLNICPTGKRGRGSSFYLKGAAHGQRLKLEGSVIDKNRVGTKEALRAAAHYSPQRDSDADHFIGRIGPWIEEMASLAAREDWNGFERSLEIFLNSQDIFCKRERRLKLIDSLASDLIWSYEKQKVVGP